MCLPNLFSLASRYRNYLFICSYSWLWIHYQTQGMLCSPPFCAPFKVPPHDLGSLFTSQPLLIIAICASLCRDTLGHSWLLDKCRRHTWVAGHTLQRETDHTQTQAPKTEKSKVHVNLIWTSFLQPEREGGNTDFCLCIETDGDYFKGRSGQISVDNTSLGIYFNRYPAWG